MKMIFRMRITNTTLLVVAVATDLFSAQVVALGVKDTVESLVLFSRPKKSRGKILHDSIRGK